LSAFQVWIEAEHWAPGQWEPSDDVTDTIVTFADGRRWTATFCAFAHIAKLRQNLAENGECLRGKYLWVADLILIDSTSRESIETAIHDLLAQGEFKAAFSEVAAESDEPAA
jgi:hypothetical protein